MTPASLIDTLAQLEAMPYYLERAARDTGLAAATAPGPDGDEIAVLRERAP